MSSVLSEVISFCCCGCHRYLHSFPTRRSSDLVDRGGRGGADRGDDRDGPPAGRPILRDRPFQRRHVHLEPVVRGEDRKSTRLNSSHPSISYAVFCLKKKKNCLYAVRNPPLITY